jgi:hypothetical protein
VGATMFLEKYIRCTRQDQQEYKQSDPGIES